MGARCPSGERHRHRGKTAGTSLPGTATSDVHKRFPVEAVQAPCKPKPHSAEPVLVDGIAPEAEVGLGGLQLGEQLEGVAVVTVHAVAGGADPQVAGAVFVHRIDFVACQTGNFRKGGDFFAVPAAEGSALLPFRQVPVVAAEPKVPVAVLEVQGHVVGGESVGGGELVKGLAVVAVRTLVGRAKPQVAVACLAHVHGLVAGAVGAGQGRLGKHELQKHAQLLPVEPPVRLHPQGTFLVKKGPDRAVRKSRGVRGTLQGGSVPCHQCGLPAHVFVGGNKPQPVVGGQRQPGHPISHQPVLLVEFTQLAAVPHERSAAHRAQPQVSVGVFNGAEGVVGDLVLVGGVVRDGPWGICRFVGRSGWERWEHAEERQRGGQTCGRGHAGKVVRSQKGDYLPSVGEPGWGARYPSCERHRRRGRRTFLRLFACACERAHARLKTQKRHPIGCLFCL